MKNRLFLSVLMMTCATLLNAQDLTVPESILNELQTKKIPVNEDKKDTMVFKVVYPDDYDSTKTYPVLLGLSGGNQGEDIVNYCYAAWFKSELFKNYLTIMPINNNHKNLMYYSSEDIKMMLRSIKDNFQTAGENWVIVGTSNGGRATFNFISEDPALFQGAIVIPGILDDPKEVNSAWGHLKIILAYGEKDSKDWIKGAQQAKSSLSTFVNSVQTIVLKEQGHILPLDFDLDFVYKRYFEKDK